LISAASESAVKAQFVECKKLIAEASGLKESLSGLIQDRSATREKAVKESGITQNLLAAFKGDINRALQFMTNVANLKADRIDSHEISCGRARVRAHLEAIGGPDFFCGADPNDVKYYVSEYHFGGNEYYEEPPKTTADHSSKNDDMAEALRRAGLIP
jgi:hypothetical protein